MTLQAHADRAKIVNLYGQAEITIEAGEGKGPPTFEMLAYAGGAFRPKIVPPIPHAIVVDLAGLESPKEQVPAHKDHDETQFVGHTTNILNDQKRLVASGIVSGAGAAAKEVLAAAANGFKWPVSIGAGIGKLEFVKPGTSATANGQTFNGPIYIARASRLREISFLTIAADDDAVASIAAEAAESGEVMDFAAWLQANGFQTEAELSETQLKVLKAAYAKSGDKLGDVELGILKASCDALKATRKDAVTEEDRNLQATLERARKRRETVKAIADLTATAITDNPDSLDVIEAMSQKAIEAGWDTQRYELELLRACRPQATPSIHVSRGDDQLSEDVIEAAMATAGGLGNLDKHYSERTLEAANKRFRGGLHLVEALQLSASRVTRERVSVSDIGGMLRAAFAPSDRYLRASGVSTYSLPGILSNVANKAFRDSFNAVESTWRAIAAVRPLKDFKQATTYSLTGDFEYREIPAAGKLEHATLGEESYTNQLKSYGRISGIDRRDIINDDLGVFMQISKKNGRGAALAFNLVFWTAFMDNASFFSSGNANYLSGVTVGTNDSRLNIEGLTRAETAFLNQTDPDGKPLGAMPRILLVPNALQATGSVLMSSTEVRDTTANTLIPTGNPHAGKFSVVRSTYLSNTSISGYSTTAWHLLADPNDIPVIEAGFLNGKETPTVEQAAPDFDQLGVMVRGYHDFGVAKQEYRGGVKSKGAS